MEPSRYSLKMLPTIMAEAKWGAAIEEISTEKFISLAIKERAVKLRARVQRQETAQMLKRESE